MGNVLIVSDLESAKKIEALIRPMGFEGDIFEVADCVEARKIVLTNDVDYVFINTPLSDEFGHEFAMSISSDSTASVVLFATKELADEISDEVSKDGVFVVPKPIDKFVFLRTVRLAGALRRKVLGLERANIKLKTTIEQMRLIDRAKCTLIQYLNMTEKQAHRYIEKQAMDMHTTKAEIAQGILKTYET